MGSDNTVDFVIPDGAKITVDAIGENLIESEWFEGMTACVVHIDDPKGEVKMMAALRGTLFKGVAINIKSLSLSTSFGLGGFRRFAELCSQCFVLARRTLTSPFS